MRKVNYILIIALSVFASGCAIFNKYNIEEEQALIQSKVLFDKSIAVLNFEKSGNDLPPGIEKNLADKLSESLFMTGKFNTIERSVVNNAQIGLKIMTTEILSPDKIKELGKAIDANYLIFGKILDNPAYLRMSEDPKGKLTVSIRIISIETLKIVGAATMSISYENDLQDKLNLIVEKISKKICGVE